MWPGLRLIGAGGKIPKGVFVAVAEVEPDGVRLDNGMRLKNQELLRATRAAEDPAVHGASALGGRDLLQVRDSVQEADAAVDQHALEAEARPVQARQPLRGVAGRQAPPGRAAGAAADGGAVREGQPITRAALQRPCCAVRGDCARGHGGACGAAEHSGLDRSGFV